MAANPINVPIKHYKQIFTANYELQKIQSNVSESMDSITMFSLLTGNFIDVTVKTTDTYIEHGLGRKYNGWLVCDKDASAIIFRSSTSNPRPESQLILKSSAQTVARIYIF
jgi:hypothetical protein